MEETYSFGYWVQRRRKALDLTRAGLAQRVSCSQETIKKIERDERRPSLQVAKLLANVLAVPRQEQELFLQAARGERSVAALNYASEPLFALPIPPTNLPPQLTPFIGREAELATIVELLDNPECRLLTLVGPGGVGKSRIALRAAERQVGSYRHGVYLVPLAGVKNADDLPYAVAMALYLELKGQVRLQLIRYLKDTGREVLLVLDNFEHLLGEARFLIELLLKAPRIRLLVTSRERLNVQPEWVLPVSGLPYPDTETTEDIDRYSSVSLFMETARRIQPGFAPDETEKLYLARICQLVEGLPLAIELATAWTRSLTCEEIASEIEHGIDILAASARDVPDRHRSIRAVFDHSWNLLSADEQRVMRLLSIFHGGFTRQAAEQVAGTSLPLLSALVDKSLIQVDQRPGQEHRYTMHDLIQQCAFERLLAEGEVEIERAREKHLETFVSLAEQAEPALQGPNHLSWLDRIERDFDNLRAAFVWATDPIRGRDGEHAQRLLRALHWYWCLRGHIDEALHWAERTLSMDSPNEAVRAKAMWVWGYLNFFYGKQELARDLMEQSVELCLKVGSCCNLDLAYAYNFLGIEAYERGEIDIARSYNEKSLALRRELDHLWGIAQSLNNLGFSALACGEFTESKAFYEEGLLIARRLGEPSKIASLLNNLGRLVASQGDVVSARSMFRESLQLCRALRWQWLAAGVFMNLAVLEVCRSEASRFERAVRLCGSAEMLLKSWGSTSNLEESIQEIQAARDVLGEAAFSIAFSEGRRMTFDQAIAYALEDQAS